MAKKASQRYKVKVNSLSIVGNNDQIVQIVIFIGLLLLEMQFGLVWVRGECNKRQLQHWEGMYRCGLKQGRLFLGGGEFPERICQQNWRKGLYLSTN